MVITTVLIVLDHGRQLGAVTSSLACGCHGNNGLNMSDDSDTGMLYPLYTYMMRCTVRQEIAAILVLLVLSAATTLPWPILELFHIFGHVRGSKPSTSSLISKRLILQVLPYIYYMFQPLVLVVGFQKLRKGLKFSPRLPLTEQQTQLANSLR